MINEYPLKTTFIPLDRAYLRPLQQPLYDTENVLPEHGHRRPNTITYYRLAGKGDRGRQWELLKTKMRRERMDWIKKRRTMSLKKKLIRLAVERDLTQAAWDEIEAAEQEFDTGGGMLLEEFMQKWENQR